MFLQLDLFSHNFLQNRFLVVVGECLELSFAVTMWKHLRSLVIGEEDGVESKEEMTSEQPLEATEGQQREQQPRIGT